MKNERIIDDNNFKFQNQRCMLIYDGILDKSSYRSWLEEKNKKEFTRFEVLIENQKDSDETLTKILVDFGQQIRTKNRRFFDYEAKHPKIICYPNSKTFDDISFSTQKRNKLGRITIETNDKEDSEELYLLFNSFLEEIGDHIASSNKINKPNRNYDSSKTILRKLPLRMGDWLIGNGDIENLKEIDQKLHELIKNHPKYNFDNYKFYCWARGDKIYFEIE